MKEKELEKRILSEQQCMGPIDNNDLVCKDCEYKYDDSVFLGNTSVCEKYGLKPNKVLLGGDCDEHSNKK